ncbi:MAG: response regulator [Pseudomonadota bacterium]
MPKNVLVADDSVVIQKSIGITFAQEDFAITYVGNGEDAIAKAKQIKPDIVLADVVMPKKNGYEVCDALKKDPQLRGIPVLLLAGTHEPFDDARGKEAGADGHVMKPFESKILLDRVRDLIGGKAPTVETAPSPASTIAAREPVVIEEISPSPASTIAAQTPMREVPMLDLDIVESEPLQEPEGKPIATFAAPEIELEAPASLVEPMAIDLDRPEPAPPAMTEELQPSEALPTDNFWDFGQETAQVATPPPHEEPAASSSWGDLPQAPWEAPAEGKAPLPAAGPTDEFGFDLMTDAKRPEAAVAVPVPSADKTEMASIGAGPTLSEAQIEEIVTRVFRNVIERIAWEVVPDLAETIIKEELSRLTQEKS